MSNNSNHSEVLLILGIVLGSIVFTFMFLGSDMERPNTLASFGHLAGSSVNELSNYNKSSSAYLEINERRSNFSNASLPSYKSASGVTINVAASNIGFPIASVASVDVQNLSQNKVILSRNINISRDNNPTLSYTIGNVDGKSILNTQNSAKSKTNVLFLQETSAAAMSVQKGSKSVITSLSNKTEFTPSKLLSNNTIKKVGGSGSPGEPVSGGNLPIGDGVWIMLLFAASYKVICYRF